MTADLENISEAYYIGKRNERQGDFSRVFDT
jgi:hypothetical protein